MHEHGHETDSEAWESDAEEEEEEVGQSVQWTIGKVTINFSDPEEIQCAIDALEELLAEWLGEVEH